MKRTMPAILMILCVLNTRAQSDTVRPMRLPYKISLAIEARVVYSFITTPGPYMDEYDTLRVYPGETVFVEVEAGGDAIKKMKVVQRNINPEKTITIHFYQVAENMVHKSMEMTIDNPFDKTLLYHAQMALPMRKRWDDLTAGRVAAKSSAAESWPQLITSILLDGWKFTK